MHEAPRPVRTVLQRRAPGEPALRSRRHRHGTFLSPSRRRASARRCSPHRSSTRSAQDAVVELWFQHGPSGGASSPIAFSNTRMLLPPDRDAYDVMTVSLLVTTTAADEFVELNWHTDASEMQLATVPAAGGRPAIPAVMLAVLPVA